jgi:hypothetical protein
MATSAYRNKNLRRPRKTAGERRARMKNHRNRLAALGFDEKELLKMGPKTLRQTVAKAESEAAKKIKE